MTAPESKALAEHDPAKTNQQQGLYRKFEVWRTDGSDKPGGKHDGCNYYVLDVDHDKHARAALAAYADSVAATHPVLAADMREHYGLSVTGESTERAAFDAWWAAATFKTLGTDHAWAAWQARASLAASTPSVAVCAPHGLVACGRCTPSVEPAGVSEAMTKEWCAAYPASAAYIINTLATRLDALAAPEAPQPKAPPSVGAVRALVIEAMSWGLSSDESPPDDAVAEMVARFTATPTDPAVEPQAVPAALKGSNE